MEDSSTTMNDAGYWGEYFVIDAFIRNIFFSTFKVKLLKGIRRCCVKASPAGFYLRWSYLGQERCAKNKTKRKMYLHYQVVCISPPGSYFRWSLRGQDHLRWKLVSMEKTTSLNGLYFHHLVCVSGGRIVGKITCAESLYLWRKQHP